MVSRGISIRCPFGDDLPPPMDEFYLEYQVVRLRDGLLIDEEKHEIIMSHTRLAIALASSWGRKAPYLINDLVQEALYGMVRAIDEAPQKLYNNNLTGFLIQRAKNAIYRCIDNEQIVPQQRRHEALKKNPSLLFPVYKENDRDHSRLDYDLRMVEIMDQIRQCIEKDTNLKRREYKKVIVRLRAAGYNSKEIASIIEVHRNYVQNCLRELEKEYAASNAYLFVS